MELQEQEWELFFPDAEMYEDWALGTSVLLLACGRGGRVPGCLSIRAILLVISLSHVPGIFKPSMTSGLSYWPLRITEPTSEHPFNF